MNKLKNKILISIFFSVFLLLVPSVKAANFTDNQTVDANKTWTIKFTQEIDENGLLDALKSYDGISIKDDKGKIISAGFELQPDNKIIKVYAPAGGYLFGKSYTLNIGRGVHSKSNKLLKNSYTLHFSIESDAIVIFKDKNFEQAVRDTINKQTGDIYKSDVKKITKLDIQGKNIQDIGGIQNLTNLRMFYSNSKISDLSPLKELTSLTDLSLNDAQITDISPLKNLTNLQQLYLVYNRISDISVLKGLTNLQELDLIDNEISDISALRNLVNLEILRLGDGMGGNNISDLTPISGLKNLQYLWITNNKISDISVVKNLTNLKELFAGLNQISDISPLQVLTNLKTLDLDNNQISDSDKQSLKKSLPNCNIVY